MQLRDLGKYYYLKVYHVLNVTQIIITQALNSYNHPIDYFAQSGIDVLSLKSSDRNATASSVESAAIIIGSSGGFDSLCFIIDLAFSTEFLNNEPVNGGLATADQSVQHLSKDRVPCELGR